MRFFDHGSVCNNASIGRIIDPVTGKTPALARRQGMKMRFQRSALGLMLAAALGAVTGYSGSARAEAMSLAGQDENQWRFVLTPYLFLPFSTTGTSTVAGQTANLDMNLSEVLDILQGAASIRGEAWKGDFGIITEFYYTKIGLDTSKNIGPAGGTKFQVEAKTEQAFFSVMGAWRFMNGTYGSEGRRYALDVSGGARWNKLTQDINTKITFPFFALIDGVVSDTVKKDFGGTETWWEPVVSLRGAWEVADRWTLGARVDLAGFGVNGDDLQYLVLAGADWRVWEKTSLKMGYQFYGIDYSTEKSDGKFAYDIDQNGPYLGLTFRF
jgi:hypothetical protein